MPRLLPAFLLLILALATKAPAQEEATPTIASLIPEPSAIAPGNTFTIAFRLQHPEGWHSYYVNPGGTEKVPSIIWTLPEGFKAGPIQWPVPVATTSTSETNFVYEQAPTFLIQITPSATLKPGSTVDLKAKASWQICRPGKCNDESGSFKLTLPVKAEPERDEARASLFADARRKLPAAADGWTFTAENGPDIILRVTPPAGTTFSADLDFIPAVPFLASVSQGGKVAQSGNDWIFTLKRIRENALGRIEQGKELSGILISKNEYSIAVPSSILGKPLAHPLSFSAFLPVLGGMLLGGLILNLMPCVFPVLGLKIMGFVQQSGQDRRKVMLHGLTFAAGVLLSFWIVSGILFALREHSTAEIGWGYQMQNKWFVYGLVMLFYIFGLSMFGLFELGTSATGVGGKLQTRQGLAGSFFSGVLATIAATPCSAPVLGPAIGAAIVLPTAQFFTAFTVMALGLSLPYLLLSLFPRLIGLLPRPGAWMESFKQAMSFLLIGAAGYFFWVYVDHVEPDVLVLVIFGMVLIAMAGWIFGRWATAYRSTRVRYSGRISALAVAALGFYLATGPYKGLPWERWSQGKAEDYLDKDQPVFVDFTAKWCPTCQVNKKLAYTPEVVALFKERGVIPLQADKTKPDPEIDAKLAELGRGAIPVNVLYVPGKPPIVTTEVLTPEYMKELITREVPPHR